MTLYGFGSSSIHRGRHTQMAQKFLVGSNLLKVAREDCNPASAQRGGCWATNIYVWICNMCCKILLRTSELGRDRGGGVRCFCCTYMKLLSCCSFKNFPKNVPIHSGQNAHFFNHKNSTNILAPKFEKSKICISSGFFNEPKFANISHCAIYSFECALFSRAQHACSCDTFY